MISQVIERPGSELRENHQEIVLAGINAILVLAGICTKIVGTKGIHVFGRFRPVINKTFNSIGECAFPCKTRVASSRSKHR